MRPKFWRSINALTLLLLPFSLIYYVIFLINAKLQRLRAYRCSCKIISIGNNTVGGAGKTPIAIELAKMMKDRKVVFVTKGYRGNIKTPVFVDQEMHSALEVGDEALLLARVALTVKSDDKLAGVKLAETVKPDVIIIDDGLQKENIIKDLSILIIDQLNLGNGLLLPAGPMRESLRRAKNKSDIILEIGEDIILYNDLVKSYTKVVAFAAIAQPEKFFGSLSKAGYEVLHSFKFGDHHYYNEQEIEDMIKLARELGADLVTTSKDYVKIPVNFRAAVKEIQLNLEIRKDLGALLVKANIKNIYEYKQ